jgi:hypothetical protein
MRWRRGSRLGRLRQGPRQAQAGRVTPVRRLRQVFPDAPGRLTRLPVVLLTNGRTASAAEVLAGALQGNQRCAAIAALLPNHSPYMLTYICFADRRGTRRRAAGPPAVRCRRCPCDLPYTLHLDQLLHRR